MKNDASFQLIAIFLIACTIEACGLLGNSSSQQDFQKYFPKDIGTHWTYVVTDTAGRITDTLHVTIQRNTQSTDNVEMKVWYYQTSDSSYYRYVVLRADSLFMFADTKQEKLTLKLVKPYSIGSFWNSPGFGWDQNRGYSISQIDTLKLAGKSTVPSYLVTVVSNSSPTGAARLEEELWVAPSIGIVKYKRYTEKQGFFADYQYTLIEYNQ